MPGRSRPPARPSLSEEDRALLVRYLEDRHAPSWLVGSAIGESLIPTVEHLAKIRAAYVPFEDPPPEPTAPAPSVDDHGALLQRQLFDSGAWHYAAAAIRGHQGDIFDFIARKWRDITSSRRQFGLAPDTPYPIQVESEKLRRLGLEKLAFTQDGSDGLRLSVMITIVGESWSERLGADGRLQGGGMPSAQPPEFVLLVNLAVIVYLADLVIPATLRLSEVGTVHRDKSQPSVRSRQLDKFIPRPQRTGGESRPRGSTHPSAAAYHVDPFRRRLPGGQAPSFHKIVEADQFGIDLQGPGYPVMQYTFVREHIRGDGPLAPALAYRHGYQAIKALDTMLQIFGL